MRIKRQDGKVFTLETVQYKRGEWGWSLTEVDGETLFSPTYSDPDYSTEREARKAARHFATVAVRVPRWGWVSPTPNA
jgi:hypothetical protein